MKGSARFWLGLVVGIIKEIFSIIYFIYIFSPSKANRGAG